MSNPDLSGFCGLTSDDGDGVFGRSGRVVNGLCAHGRRANNIESGHAEQALGVESASVLENLGGDGDGRVDRVGDDADEAVKCCKKDEMSAAVGSLLADSRLGAVLGNTLSQVADDASVDGEQVITSHARLWVQDECGR